MKTLLVLMTFILCSCVPPDIKLTDEYTLISIYGRTRILTNSKNYVVIEENAAGAFLVGKFIVGERVMPGNFDPKLHSSIFGCFVINTSTGEVLQGMTKPEIIIFTTDNSLKARKIGRLTCQILE